MIAGQLHLGTSSWSSADWVGPFYPPGTPPERFIEHYATVYDTVEVDATYYRMPTKANVDAWRNRTPEGFTFAVKTPGMITHEKALVEVGDDMAHFLEVITGLGPRLGPVLLQFPYFNKGAFTSAAPFLERLDAFLGTLPREVRFAVVVRNKAWVKQSLVDLCRSHRVALAWVEQAWMPSAAEWPRLTGGLTTDFAYVRFLGCGPSSRVRSEGRPWRSGHRRPTRSDRAGGEPSPAMDEPEATGTRVGRRRVPDAVQVRFHLISPDLPGVPRGRREELILRLRPESCSDDRFRVRRAGWYPGSSGGRAGRVVRAGGDRARRSRAIRGVAMGEETEKAGTPLRFRIHGMDCADEVASLRREVGPVVGGESNLAFDVLNGRMMVTSSDPDLSVEAVVRAVARTGMRAELWKKETPDTETVPAAGRGRLRDGRAIATLASGVLLASGFVCHTILAGTGAALGLDEAPGAGGVPIPAIVLYVLGIVSGAWFIVPKAWAALRSLRPDMNLLMTIAVIGAAAIGEWFEAATVAFLFAVSLLLETWSVARARRAIAALMSLTPPTVTVLREHGDEDTVPPDRVRVGARFLVRPGERIALDGNVVAGAGEVNQAPITGESAPVFKTVGAPVFAGTVNGDGVLEIESTRPASNTVVARIVRTVEEAGARRAPAEKWVDRFARIYTPVVMILAAGVLLIPPLLFGGLWQEWLYRALVLLVIGCPCALVISTPVSVVSALAAASRNGVLVKGGAFIEAPAHVRAVALDKTGTLTTGTPAVDTVVSMSGHTEGELLALAAALESRSEHPLAAAIVGYAQEQGIESAPAQDVSALRGKGATGVIDGVRYWVGSHRYADERGQGNPALCERLDAMAAAGATVVVVGNDEHVCGLIGLRDGVRPGMRAVLDELRAAGVRRIVMLTGDNQGTASVVGAETGVDEVRAELLPEDKVAAVEALVAEFGSVAMVGDGVNDAPAMARATFGVAMGAVGSDAAIETADIALMSDDLAKLPWLIRHSRRTITVIRQNIGFALSIKVLFTVLTFAGVASLWGAIAADMGASLLVVFNGLRLLRTRNP